MVEVKTGKRESLPRDVDALLAIVEKRDEQIAALEHNLAVYARMLYGDSSEKRKLTGLASGHPHQLHLFLADLVADAERIAEETGAIGDVEVERPDPTDRTKRTKRTKKKGRRNQFPDHLPGVTTTIMEVGDGRANFVARLSAPNATQRPVLVLGHMDVVGAQEEHWDYQDVEIFHCNHDDLEALKILKITISHR